MVLFPPRISAMAVSAVGQRPAEHGTGIVPKLLMIRPLTVLLPAVITSAAVGVVMADPLSWTSGVALKPLVPSIMTLLVIVGRGLVGRMVWRPLPGIANVIVLSPGFAFERKIAARRVHSVPDVASQPLAESPVEFTTYVVGPETGA